MIFFIAFILLIIGFVTIFIIANKSSSKLSHCFLLWILFLIIGGILISETAHSESPEAIDVYRGKTNLVITETVKNGIVTKCDTIVEFK